MNSGMDDIQDIEGHPPSEQQPSVGFPWGGMIGTLGVILLVVFAVQNTETVSIDFLWMTGEFPLSIVILVSAVSAAVVTVVAGALYRRRRRRRLAEKHELRQLRGDS